MDQINQTNNQILGQLTQFKFLKKFIQILLSISAFSILFSVSPFFPLFRNWFTSFSLQIFSYTTDRNYIFLVCNGILVFLIKNSSTNTDEARVEKLFDHQKSVPEVSAQRVLAREEVVEYKEEKGRENQNFVTARDMENETLTSQDETEEEQEEEEEEEEAAALEITVTEEEEEECMGLMSAEELNKKCEDFIRKVREGIKIEAQNNLILV